MIRLAVDIGGTFTDIVLQVDDRLHAQKVLTTPRHPDVAAIQGIDTLLESAGVTLRQVDSLIHGTTLATNSLIERRGAKTALVTTQGFRDVLEMRNEKRFDQYSLNIELPQPLVPRERRFVLNERMLADGTVLREPSLADIDNLATQLIDCEIEAVAIGFLHSYRYPANEERVARQLATRLPGNITICSSAMVSNEIREFDRFSTVCANAYVRPMMSRYLQHFQQQLQQRGFAGAFLMMLSSGGLTTLEQAMQTPIRLVESGPAGGALLAAHISKQVASERTLALDIGGTTAKICFIENGVPQTTRRFEVARAWNNVKGSGLPVRVPTIELVEIGAGGGSIAKIDSIGRLQVGPQSAGAEPGPCAYARGGTRATLTDAHLGVANIDAVGFAGGSIALSCDAANAAIRDQLATPLGLGSTEAAAAGVIEMADELMANAARVHGIELGKNIGSFDLLVSGGGGALHATRIAEKLGISRVIVPENAGVGSAVGFLHAPVSFEMAVTVLQSLNDIDVALLQEKLDAAMCTVNSVVNSVDNSGQSVVKVVAELRYAGQELDLRFDVDMPLSLTETLERLRQQFIDRYLLMHGFRLDDIPVEMVSCSVSAVAESPAYKSCTTGQKSANDCAGSVIDKMPETSHDNCGSRQIYDLEGEAYTRYNVWQREELPAGTPVPGPAVITEAQTTTLVRQGWLAHRSVQDHLILERQSRT